MANEFIIKHGFHSKGDSQITGSLGVTGDITSNSFIKSSGTSAQFLKADGSIDSSTYLTSVGTIDLTSGVTGTLPVGNGGTGAATFTADRVLIGNGTSAFTTDSGFTYSSNVLSTEGLALAGIMTVGGERAISSSTGYLDIGQSTAISDSRGLRFYSDENLAMTIDTNGDVGIGNNNPVYKLQVEGRIVADNQGDVVFDVNPNNGYFKIGDTATLVDGAFVEGDGSNVFIKNNGATILTVASSEKVGIGTTSPGEKLEVVGNISASGFVYGDRLYADNVLAASADGSTLRIGYTTGGDIQYGKGIPNTHLFKGKITASSDISASGTITGDSFVKGGGTSAQFLKADGSVDSSTYLTSVGTIDLTSGVTGTLPVGNGGTGLNTLTSGYIPYGNGTSAFSNNSALLFNEGIKQLRITGDSTNDPLRLSNVQTSTDETKTALILASSDGGVQKATLGSNAFNSTTIPTNNNQLTNGQGFITGAFPFTGSGGISGSLEIIGSGSGIFSVEGSIGTLFSVDDGLDDVIFAANNVSGTPVIEANADNTVKLGRLNGFGIVISGSTPAPNDDDANIIITGSIQHKGTSAYFNSAMIVGSGTATNTTNGKIVASNDVVAFSNSDKRLKENIVPISSALDKIDKIGGYEFDWKETDEQMKREVHSYEGHDVGVIAQEIEKVLPEVVTTRDNGYKAVKYEKIIPLLIESIKELKAEIEELKKSK